MNRFVAAFCLVAVLLSGCARLEFGTVDKNGTMIKENGLTYYDAKAYLFVSVNKDCVPTASVLMLPNEKKVVRLVPGMGSSDLSVALNNGMITNVGQKSDTAAPATLNALAGLAAAVPPLLAGVRTKEVGEVVICPQVSLYPIVNGKPDMNHPVVVHLRTETKTDEQQNGTATPGGLAPR
jgi:hypothetical protein